MAGILIYPAFVVLAAMLFLCTRQWLIVVCVTLVACFLACGFYFWLFDGTWSEAVFSLLPVEGESSTAEIHRAGFFGRLSDGRVIGLGLAAVVVLWLLSSFLGSTRGDVFQWDRLHGLITMAVLAAVAWVIFNYQF